jgi:hypothetical protein
VDAAEAIADLLELSSQVEAAVLFGADGSVEASSFPDAGSGTALARRALDLLAAAGGLRADAPAVSRLEASLAGGGLVVVRDDERLAAATTVADAPAALVLYDLRTALRATATPPPKPRRPRKAKASADA